MADEILRSRHAFGSSENVDAALASQAIDQHDILFLDGDTDKPKIGWIDKNGNKVIVPSCEGLNEDAVDEKLKAALDGVDAEVEGAVTTANAYTDEQIAAIMDSMAIVEF